MAGPSNENLSLGKLGVATGVTSTYTTEISMSACKRATTEASMSSYFISAVDNALDGFLYVDESTNETYDLTFADAGSLFGARIGGVAANFTWTTANSGLFALQGGATKTAQFNAGAIANVTNTVDDGIAPVITAAHAGDATVAITGMFAENGKSNGYNDHATRYSSSISKTVNIEDTYNAVAITCFLPGTLVNMADGSTKKIETLKVGDEVLSRDIPGLPDEDLGYDAWRPYTASLDASWLSESAQASASVEYIMFDYDVGYFDINNGYLKVTPEHEFFANSGEKWEWLHTAQLQAGYTFLKRDGSTVEIDSIDYIHGEVEVVNIDVEPLDVYYVEDLLVHNKGSDTETGH
jgi:hypothetical protein